MMCRLVGVSASGYYASRTRPAAHRTAEDAVLLDRIHAVHVRSRGTYGVPRIHAELIDEGTRVGRKRIARLMRAAGLRGVSRRRFVATTVRSESAPVAPDLVQRRFVAERPNQLWVADITYIPTWAGFLYLAVVLAAFSRRVVGWAMETLARPPALGFSDFSAAAQAVDCLIWESSGMDPESRALMRVFPAFMVEDPANVARYLAAVGEPTEARAAPSSRLLFLPIPPSRSCSMCALPGDDGKWKRRRP
jgi:hypothetical protein